MPIPIKDAMRMSRAKQAVDKEWNELARIALVFNTVRERSEVEDQAKRDKKSTHFGLEV